MISGVVLYAIAIFLLGISFQKNRSKTKKAIVKARKMMLNLLPDILSIMILVGLSLSILTPSFISAVIGDDSGIVGVILATILGSVALIPSFIVFPLGQTILHNGGGLPQVAVLMSTLMSVGVLTLPVEKKIFGSRFAYARNGAGIVMSLLFAVLVWGVWK
ncbi:hypothetical protein IC620_09770 [Hazenella sp. IB182357]|uniref:Permease n=1 Tax=Polycladospora coralii TaxID=2771432 RepID=A0A926N6Q3_9BACL|nr:hypothetical protein [Polycladospora coralii]MBD1372641.1 hypothetical protein [Polycladospora coralii]MBS7531251.1 hypothetical protein [Polycladospora coralii]